MAFKSFKEVETDFLGSSDESSPNGSNANFALDKGIYFPGSINDFINFGMSLIMPAGKWDDPSMDYAAFIKKRYFQFELREERKLQEGRAFDYAQLTR
jgi:hypothetical protein